MILNLKRLNKFVDDKYFKMESLQNVLELIRLGVYMASIDLKDAFYSAPADKNHQAYLTYFVEEYLKLICTTNGYGPAMQIFTKNSKIPFSIFREKGFLSVVYVDDSYLQGNDYDDCFSNFSLISWINSPPRQIQIHTNSMHHLFRIYFKLYPNDNYFNSGEKKNLKPLPRNSLRRCSYNKISIKVCSEFSSSFSCSNIGFILP